MVENSFIQNKYFVKATETASKKGMWNTLDVSIFKREGTQEERIGSYKRNYPHMFNTFYPFLKDGREFALCSLDYTATSVLELPSCKLLAVEKPSHGTICPLSYFVPYLPEKGITGQIGFAGGIFWGCEGSLTIQLLDLSLTEQGILRNRGTVYNEDESEFDISDVKLSSFIEGRLNIERTKNGFRLQIGDKIENIILSYYQL